MRFIDFVRTLYFELAYSLICENHLIHILEFFSCAFEGIQLSAFVFSPKYLVWNRPLIQNILQYTLIYFPVNPLLFSMSACVLFMLLLLVILLWQISQRGGISSFLVLQWARIVLGILSSILFFPILENAICACVKLYPNSLFFLFLIVNICGLIIPTFLIAILQNPDLKSLAFFSRSSNVQLVSLLSIKLVISLSYGILNPNIFPIVMLLCMCVLTFLAFFRPPFFFPMANVFWVYQSAALVCASSLLVASDQYPISMDIAIPFMIAFGILFSLFYMWRCSRLFSGLQLWVTEWNFLMLELRKLRNTFAETEMDYLVPQTELQKKFANVVTLKSPKTRLDSCRNSASVSFVANTLLVRGGSFLFEYCITFLSMAVKKFPDNDSLTQQWISFSANFSDFSVPSTKQIIQRQILKALHRKNIAIYTRFEYYKIIKNFEICSFREQSRDSRKLDLLEIIRYHYNYTKATKTHLMTLKYSFQFWKTCSSPHFNLKTIGSIADKMQESQSEALFYYNVLLKHFPSSVPVLRSYGSFIMDCLNNSKLGNEIIEYAEQQEEDSAEKKDDQSESTHTSYSQSTNILQSINASSMFDVDSIQESRNKVSKNNISSVRWAVRASLLLLMIAVISLYLVASSFRKQEHYEKTFLIDSGVLRGHAVFSCLKARILDFKIQSGEPINETTQKIKEYSIALHGSISSAFMAKATSSESTLDFWTTPDIPDRSFDQKVPMLSKLAFLYTFALKLTQVASSSEEELRLNQVPALQWIKKNCSPASFFDILMGIVTVSQKNFESFIFSCSETLIISMAVIAIVPILVFVFAFFPFWKKLHSEIVHINFLFALIPRKVSLKIADELNERLEEKADLEQEEEEEKESESKELELEVPKKTATHKLLFIYAFSLIFIISLSLSMGYSSLQPILLSAVRASLVNFSGARLAVVVRIRSDLRELDLMSPNDPERASLHNHINNRLNLLKEMHNGVLYGNRSMNLAKTFGMLPEADKITFETSCNTHSLDCLSLDEIVNVFSESVFRLLHENQTAKDFQTILEIAHDNSSYVKKIIELRDIYSRMNEETIFTFNLVSKVLFFLVIPVFLALYILLHWVMGSVWSRILRTRNILFQLPEETVSSIPHIKAYLLHGDISLMVETMKKNSKKHFDSNETMQNARSSAELLPERKMLKSRTVSFTSEEKIHEPEISDDSTGEIKK